MNFAFKKANPVAGATILFTHGMGLRRLAIAAVRVPIDFLLLFD